MVVFRYIYLSHNKYCCALPNSGEMPFAPFLFPPLAVGKIKIWWCFVTYPKATTNIVGPFPIPVRCPLRHFRRRGAFIAAYPADKWKATVKKGHCVISNRFRICFIAPLPILVNQSRIWSCVRLWKLGSYVISSYCSRWGFQELSQDGGRAKFAYSKSPRLFL
jgi:hypothetical protein